MRRNTRKHGGLKRKYKGKQHKKTKHTRKIKRTHHKKHNKKHSRVLKKSSKHRRSRKRHMRGGELIFDAPPFAPPGGPYQPGAENTGKNYYPLAQPEFHAPNGTALDNMQGLPDGMMKGGGIIPRDLTYLYRSAGSSLKSLYNGFTGQVNPPSANPNPMYQPEMTKPAQLDGSVPNIPDIMQKATHEASL